MTSFTSQARDCWLVIRQNCSHIFAEQHLHNTQWLYFIKALHFGMWSQSGVWAPVSNYQKQQRANTDPGFALATAGRKVLQHVQTINHLIPKLFLLITPHSLRFVQVSLCIFWTRENWLVQITPPIKIPYPASNFLTHLFLLPVWGRFSPPLPPFFFLLPESTWATFASLFTQAKWTERVHKAWYDISFLLLSSFSRVFMAKHSSHDTHLLHTTAICTLTPPPYFVFFLKYLFPHHPKKKLFSCPVMTFS